MPLGFDPQETTVVLLDCIDKGKPDADRAKFTVRFITAGEAKRIARLERDARCALSPGDADALLNQAIRIGIVGWEGLVGGDVKPVTYAPPPDAAAAAAAADAPDVLDEFSTRVKFQIVQEYPWAITLSKPERFH